MSSENDTDQIGPDASISPAAKALSRTPPLIRRNTIYFALSQALQGAGPQLAAIFGAIIVTRLLGSASLAGVGGSIINVSRFLAAYPIGKLTDTYGRRAGVVVGLLMGLTGGVLLGASVVVPSFALFLIGMVVLGLGVGANMQLRVAAADMYPPSRRGEGLGYVLTGSVGGAILGPVLVGAASIVAQRTGIDEIAVSWFLLPVALVPAMILILLVRPDPKEIASNLQRYWPDYEPPKIAPDVRASVSRVGGLSTFARHKPKQVAYLSYSASQATMAMMMVITPLVMSESGHTLTAISFAVALHVVGMFGFSIPLGRLADRVGRKRMLWPGLGVCALGALLVPATPLYWTITLGLFMVGLGWSAVNVASTSVLADTTTPAERGRAIGANDALAGAFSIITPFMGGVIADLAGLMAVGIAGAILPLLPLLLMGRLREIRPGYYAEGEATAQAGA